MRTVQAFALACLCALSPTATLRSSGQSAPADYDSEYVSMVVPPSVRANQVFQVQITMKNSGTQTWAFAPGTSSPAELHFNAPYDSSIWGTNYIIQGQGTSVAPGQQFTYKSYIRAPKREGKTPFQWRLTMKGVAFGKPTELMLINVGPPRAVNDAPPAIPYPDRTGKRPLTAADFRYLGSFRLPHTVGTGGGGFSESGISVRKYPDGTQRLFVNFNFPQGTLFEVDIPAPKTLGQFDGTNALSMPLADAKKIWGALAQNNVVANGGILWDEEKKTLYWTYYNGYWAGGALPVLQATMLNDDGTMTPAGSWTVPNQKWHWGGVTRLPKTFADRYTGGKTLALGFGGYFSVCAPCSRGPSLSVIDEADPSASAVSGLVNMVSSSDPIGAPRPGNYFLANVGFWNTQPVSRAKGTWAMGDQCRAGVMIDLPDKQGYIGFVKLGTGRMGYDYAAGTTAGKAYYWYFYDTRHLGQVARGDRKPENALPYLVHRDRMVGGLPTGAYFDPQSRNLYVIKMQSYKSGLENFPLVHVYHIKKG